MRFGPDPNKTASKPWFRAHPCAATIVAAALFAGVVMLQALDAKAADAIALLYVLPIALAAVTFGLAGGLVAASAGYALVAVFAMTNTSGHITIEGWVSRAAAMFLLGGLLGRARDQIARAGQHALASQRELLTLEERNRRFAEGLELSDSILQHVAAAKWLAEQGNNNRAARLLSEALERGQRMVGELLPAHSTTSAPTSCSGYDTLDASERAATASRTASPIPNRTSPPQTTAPPADRDVEARIHEDRESR